MNQDFGFYKWEQVIETNNLNIRDFIYEQDFNFNISKTIKLDIPTNDTGEILNYIIPVVKNLYKTGYQYKKVGVILNGA